MEIDEKHVDIHWRRGIVRNSPWQFQLTDLLIGIAFLGALIGIYRSLGACFGFFPAIIATWLFVAWRLGAKGVRFWLVPCALAIPAFLVATMPHVREESMRIICQNHLRQIGLAISNYETTFHSPPALRTFDANSKPLHSWRTLVLPYMERQSEYRQIRLSEPWDSNHNRAVGDLVTHNSYRCLEESDDVDARWTNYLAIDGRELRSGSAPLKSNEMQAGTSNRLMLAEVSNSGIHWMEPRDLHVTQMAPWLNAKSGQGPSSRHGAGVNVIFTDGRVDTLSPETDPAVLRAMLNGE
jgi:prepilin-type processing-associated H-X9-DG protein